MTKEIISSYMNRIIASIAILAFSLSASGCATLITGPSQKIQVSSNPAGATVQVDEKLSYITPVKIKLKRNRDHVLVFKKEGYEDQAVKLLHVLSGAVCGNVVLFGLAGLAADNLSGAQFKLVPGSVHAELRKSQAVTDQR